jgi:membrane protease YdiL (CAAX protease family)
MWICRSILILLGTLMIFFNRKTLASIIDYYLYPKSQTTTHLLKIKHSSIISSIFLSLGGCIFITAFLPSIGVPKSLAPYNLDQALILFIIVGIIEESFFRIIPWLIFLHIKDNSTNNTKVERLQIIIALVTSFVFGLLHVIVYDNPTVWSYIGTIRQMIYGLVFWYLLDTEGVLACIVAHTGLDLVIWALSQFLL